MRKKIIQRGNLLKKEDEALDKVLTSPALNGGFDKLLFTVDALAEGQERLVHKVDLIHDAIYDPDQGLFARIRSTEAVQQENIADLEKDVLLLKSWKSDEEKQEPKDDASSEKQTLQVASIVSSLAEIEKWKLRWSTIAKWIIVTMAGGSASMLGKLIYDWFCGHVKFS